MNELRIENLHAAVDATPILHGINLTIASGEVHAIMGPNGSGKSTLSHVIMGKPGYTVTEGSITLDGIDLLGLSPWQRAQAGLHLAMQYPVEVPGVSVQELLEEAAVATGRDPVAVRARMESEALAVGLSPELLERPLNVDLSGGEKKRTETMQLAVLEPKVAVLDELDSGLDIDALRQCSRRIEAATQPDDADAGLGVLVITHYSRLLHELQPDHVHVLVRGRIVESGGPELAWELEETGYDRWLQAPAAVGVGIRSLSKKASAADDPFADPLA